MEQAFIVSPAGPVRSRALLPSQNAACHVCPRPRRRCARPRSPMTPHMTADSVPSSTSSPVTTSTSTTGKPARRLRTTRSHTINKSNESTTETTRDLDIVICHATTDFDSLASAVGLARLRGHGTKVVIPAGEHEAVQRYLSLHRGLFPLIDMKAVDPERLRWVGVVDTHSRKRLGGAAAFVDAAQDVEIIDHHIAANAACDIPGVLSVEAVGAVSTIVVERLMAREAEGVETVLVSPAEATLLALGIHTDTGNLCWETTTPRDAAALAWCLSRGASQRSIAQFARSCLTPEQQRLLSVALDSMSVRTEDGVSIATVVVESPAFVKGMAAVTQAAMELSDVDVLLLASVTPAGRKGKRAAKAKDKASASETVAATPGAKQVSLIGRARSRVEGVDFSALLARLGGGGHAKAASASLKVDAVADVYEMVDDLEAEVVKQLPPPVLVKDFMSRKVVCIGVKEPMEVARQKLFDLGHTGLPVVVVSDSDARCLVGVVSRQDVALAERRGKLDTPVKGWISRTPICASEDMPLHEAEALLADNKIGRLPVVRDGEVVGIVTRSDILVQRRLLSQ